MSIIKSLTFIPGGRAWENNRKDFEALKIFRSGIKYIHSGEGLPQMGSEPILPIQALCLSYVAQHSQVVSLGVRVDPYSNREIRVPGFLGAASYTSILAVIPDGLQAGELSAPHVFVQPGDLVARLHQVVFFSHKFGHCAPHVFKRRYPTIPLQVFFIEIISDLDAFWYFKTNKTKPGHSRLLGIIHTHITSQCTVHCDVCNIVWQLWHRLLFFSRSL